jgi:uncharacterized protein (TIGR03083 family)
MLSVRELARLERADFAEMLAELTPEQWTERSLCEGWTVRDVVAHTIAYLGQSRVRLLINIFRARGNIDRLNAAGLREYAEAESAQLVELMRRAVEPSGVGALYGARVALVECLIHQQDIRRSLGNLRDIPEERLRASLNYARVSPVIGGARRTRGFRLVATDFDWIAGGGLEIRGSGEALLLAMTGRVSHVRGELSGAGVPLLV